MTRRSEKRINLKLLVGGTRGGEIAAVIISTLSGRVFGFRIRQTIDGWFHQRPPENPAAPQFARKILACKTPEVGKLRFSH
ncbi:hypothetical protein U8335_04920 [Roseiconus lacunae]|uniref:hypothetical protein n=1 Tax=Roseiconus lacunae TaxID=2605694 RepID=UPI003086F52F|nr:hypothetical protein U8335_04920 [Stieleria sp. HD01]